MFSESHTNNEASEDHEVSHTQEDILSALNDGYPVADPKTNYPGFLRELIASFAKNRAVLNQIPTAADLVAFLHIGPDFNNTAMRDYGISVGISAKDFERAISRRKVTEELHGYPTSPTHFVELYVKRNSVEALYNGDIRWKPRVFIKNAKGAKEYPTEVELKELDKSGESYFRDMLQIQFPPITDSMRIKQNLRVMKNDFKLPYTDAAIDDAVSVWHRDAKRARLTDIFAAIGNCAFNPREQDPVVIAFRKLIEASFDTTETSVEFVMAVMAKFAWMVKRKIANRPVTDHIMPVIVGPQGCGKTTFMEKFLKPVEELCGSVSFRQVEDDRNIDIWNNYVLVIDEMGYANRTDTDMIKHAITATHLSRRPMRTNDNINVQMNSSFIGASNKSLAQLILDPTGNRRFVELTFRNDADRAVINAFDFESLWTCKAAGHDQPDPMLPFRDQLANLQAATKALGPVEEWMTTLDPDLPRYNRGQPIAPDDLYLLFSDWETHFRPGARRTTKQDWDAILRPLLKADKGVGRLPIERSKNRRSYGFPYVVKA